MYRYSEAFLNQPSSFVSNLNQRIFVISSYHDSLWVDLDQDIDCDLDETFDVGAIVKVIFDLEDDRFYFLANLRNGILGYYLIQFDSKNPGICQFLSTVRNPLNIDDATMHIFNELDPELGVLKELVIGFKTININTYNVMTFDISGASKRKDVIFNHESYQLWESKMYGLLLNSSNEFVTLSKTGINVVSFGASHKKYL